jgi:hypothetical protein
VGELSPDMQTGLDDLLGDLWYARRRGDLGRLALLGYCEVRRWARQAGEPRVATHSSQLITHGPHATRDEFLAQVDDLIGELEAVRCRVGATSTAPCTKPASPLGPPVV